MRVGAAAAVKRLGFTPVPHISSRRIKSQEMLEEYLEALRDVGAAENVLVIGGDPTVATGPYEDSLAVIESGVLQQYGVRHISIGGHPAGAPEHPRPTCSGRRCRSKAAALARLQIPGTIITQVDFDVDRVLQLDRRGARARRRAAGPRRRPRPGQRQAAARLRLPARPVHVAPRSRRSTACRSPTCSARRVPTGSSATCRPASTRPSTARSSCTSTPSAASRRRRSGSRTSARSSDQLPPRTVLASAPSSASPGGWLQVLLRPKVIR